MPTRKIDPPSLTPDELAAIHWFLDHQSFSDYLESVPPHLGKDACTDKAYEIRDALGKLQSTLLPSRSGDWMYRS
jgi:hypothetical protein